MTVCPWLPLGYLIAIQMQGYFGVITGTNSFTMAPGTGKIARPAMIERLTARSW